MSRSEAEILLRYELDNIYGNAINTFLIRNPNVKINQYQFDALASFVYNHGPGYMTNTGQQAGDTMRNFLTNGDYSQIATLAAFTTYTSNPARRLKEANLFSSQLY